MGGSDLGSWGEFAEDCSTLRLLPLDLAHMGTDNPARKVSEHIKCDHVALRVRVKVKGAEMVFSLIQVERLKEEWLGLEVQHLVVQLCH